MHNRKVYISGEIVPEVDAKISIFDSAVLLGDTVTESCLLYTSPSPRDRTRSRMPSSA